MENRTPLWTETSGSLADKAQWAAAGAVHGFIEQTSHAHSVTPKPFPTKGP